MTEAVEREYFTAQSFTFLTNLAANNSKAWFQAHREEYDAYVRAPFQRLLVDLQPILEEISPHFRADPRGVGGSLFRIHRDARFSHDKAPYKSWQGARLYHTRRREVAAPAFYLHLQPGSSFIGAGIWHPEPKVLQTLRQFIFENPASWEAAVYAPKVQATFTLLDEEKLLRPPRGFPSDFAFIDDLKLKNIVMWRALDESEMVSPNLVSRVAEDLRLLSPFMDYLCAALELEF